MANSLLILSSPQREQIRQPGAGSFFARRAWLAACVLGSTRWSGAASERTGVSSRGALTALLVIHVLRTSETWITDRGRSPIVGSSDLSVVDLLRGVGVA